MMLTSNDPQTLIRVARKPHGCSCHLRAHHGEGRDGHGNFCGNVIAVGDVYPEYVGEVAAFQSGARYCPDCRKDQLGDWISE